MNVISLKMDEVMLKEIDDTINKTNFSTRTEFIRSAIRKKLEKMNDLEFMKHFTKDSTMTEKDALKFGRKVNATIVKKHLTLLERRKSKKH